MRIIIVGAGLVGKSLAEQLLAEGNDISIIEKDSDLCHKIEEKLDVLVVEGSGSNPRIIEAAGVKNADILLAVTPEDEVNILACSIAARRNVPKRIARIRNRDYIHPPDWLELEQLGVTQLIDPEMAVVDAINQFVMTPGVIEAASFEHGRILLREFKVTSGMPIVGKSLMEIRAMAEKHHILIMTIVRNDRAIIPSGDIIIEDGDEILALFLKDALHEFHEVINPPFKRVKKLIISGGSLTSFKLARSLEPYVDNIIWVCPDYKYGAWAANQLNSVQIMHGDSTEIDLLKEIHIENAHFFIGASDNTEHNILSSLLAKSQGVRETIAVSNQPAKSNKLFKSIGIDHVINPRLTTATSIMDLIHRGRILTEVRIRDMDLEAIRISADANSKIIGRPLAVTWKKLAKKAIVGAVIREDKIMIPSGNTTIHAGDQVFVIARAHTVKAINKLFRSR